MAEEAEVAALRLQAEDGDVIAMNLLGRSYRNGTRGLKQDDTLAFMWIKRAADLKDVRSLTECGVCYLRGQGVESSDVRGSALIGMAAALGSEHACGLLGWSNARGHNGFEKNPQEATRWYREMQKCTGGGSTDGTRKQATEWLREHP
eukprot:scaffold20768_cov60-Phaeocystis_antarctica.AAC.1